MNIGSAEIIQDAAVKNNYSQAYLDYGIYAGKDSFAVLSFFDRSEQNVRSIGSSLTLGEGISFKGMLFSFKEKFNVYYYQMKIGKSSVWHGMAVSRLIGSRYFLSSMEDKEETFYDFLMNNYGLPIMHEWKDSIYRALEGRMVSPCGHHGKTAAACSGTDLTRRYYESRGKKYSLAGICCFEVGRNEQMLKDTISDILRTGCVHITEDVMEPLSIDTQDSYFKNYGASIVENLRGVVRPVSELNGNTDIVFNAKRMYPQQIAVVNAQAEHLKKNRSGLIIAKMGSGKTLMGLGIAEKYFADRAVRRGEIKEIKDAYRDAGSLNYRVAIMCPGHLVEKWANEIVMEVPFAKATVVTQLSQLTDLYKSGAARNGREYYIISKDTIKLAYQEIPTPKKISGRRLAVKKCKKCESVMRYGTCSVCGSREYKLEKYGKVMHGICCPYCNELLFRPGDRVDEAASGEKDLYPMDATDFANKNSTNARCYYCGEELWEPYVENTVPLFSDAAKKERAWYRSTYYKNKAKNGKITCWTLKGHETDLVRMYGEPLNEMSDRTHGVRKYSLSLFIEKKMKKFFDLGIVDEVHTCKGGTSAQGISFQHILNACEKNLNLTGTITGGTAADIFYLFWRLYPRMMAGMGYSWNDVERFSEDYGVVEKRFELIGDEERWNVGSRGRQLGGPSIKPGISPRLFLKLVDKATFLDITDFSSHLPDFYEKVVVTDITETGSDEEKEMLKYYHSTAKFLKDCSRQKDSGGLRGMKLQFELSYLDKPYGARDIIHPKTGECLVRPDNYYSLVENGGLLSKERDLVGIIKQELAEGRGCAVFAEFTGKEETNVTARLQEVIRRECGLAENEVVILKSSAPAANKREAWMHSRAEDGMKVFICNPECVATGLDFCWVNKKGTRFNYPTIVFYQMGTSLFTIAQASRRAWRLNQTEECRVYYMGIKGTKQQALIQLIAEKTSANGVMEGRFSVDGLAAMAEGIDVDVRLAQIMSEMDQTSVDDLQGMFDVVNSRTQSDESAYGAYRKMLTYKELMGSEAAGFKTDIFSVLSSFSSTDVFSAFKGYTAGAGTAGTETPGMDSPETESEKMQKETGQDTKTLATVGLLIPDMTGKPKKRKKPGPIGMPTRTLFEVV